MSEPEIIEVDPLELHLPATREEGAVRSKLDRQFKLHSRSVKGMPPIQVSRTVDRRFVINDGVTRATRVARHCPGTKVPVEVIDDLPQESSEFPTIAERLPQ